MTQKEYKEEIEKYKNKIRQLENSITEINFEKADYERALKDYHIISDLLEKERTANVNNTWVINEQNKLIAKYEAMINRVTLSTED